jgi:FixJ family two-component response regulator
MTDNLTVFIVDDDPSVRDALGLLLGVHDYRLAVFADADSFLRALKPHWHGCLLLDIRMPGMDGLSLQKKLLELGCDLPVVIMTGHGDVDSAREAFRAMAVDFLEKPLDGTRLLAASAEAYERQRQAADAAASWSQIRAARRADPEREDGACRGRPPQIARLPRSWPSARGRSGGAKARMMDKLGRQRRGAGPAQPGLSAPALQPPSGSDARPLRSKIAPGSSSAAECCWHREVLRSWVMRPAGVDHLHVALAQHLPAAVRADQQGRLLVDADADQLWPVEQSRSAGGCSGRAEEVLVDDRIRQEAEVLAQVDRPYGRWAANRPVRCLPAGQHLACHHCGAGGRSAHDRAPPGSGAR